MDESKSDVSTGLAFILFYSPLKSSFFVNQMIKNRLNIWCFHKESVSLPTENKNDIILSGCSSVRLECTSGGRDVAGSNPVIPTMIIKELSLSLNSFCFTMPHYLPRSGLMPPDFHQNLSILQELERSSR